MSLFLGNNGVGISTIEYKSLPKFGATVDNFIGNVDANGVLQSPTTTFAFESDEILAFNVEGGESVSAFKTRVGSINLPNLASIGMAGLWNGFANCTALTSVNFPSLTTVADYGLLNCFKGCTNLLEANLPSLTTIGTSMGSASLSSAFYGCTKLQSLNLSSLTSIEPLSQALDNICYGCSSLTTINLESLQMANGMSQAFMNCTSLERVSLPNLTTIMSPTSGENGMSSAFRGCTALKYVDLAKWSYCQPLGVQNMFRGCTSLEYVNISEATAIPNGANATSMFNSTNDTYKIIVPNALYDEWIVATGWATIASHIVKASDYLAVMTNHGGQDNMDN